MPRKRDYKQEYARRVARGIASGKSRSAARGHARAEDLGPLPPTPKDRSSTYERALKEMKRGASLKSAAHLFGLKPERLRRHVKRNTTASYQGRQWVIFDLRPQPIRIVSKGRLRTVTIALDDASEVGRYSSAVAKFLATNDIDHLWPFFSQGVRDVVGKFHPFETRPNVLRKLDSIGELDFVEIYADVAQ